MKSLVTVITSSYNSAKFIEETLLSVKSQSYSPIEHIIVDGGSTDGTLDVVKRFSNVKLISEPDKGFGDACNKGIKKAKGGILNLLNADDYFYNSNSVAEAMHAFELSSWSDIVFGDVIIIDEKSKIIWNGSGYGQNYSLHDLVCSKFTFPQSSVFFRKESAENVGLLDTMLRMNEEVLLWMKIATKGQVTYVPKILSYYRTHKDQLTRKWRPNRKLVVDKFFEWMDMSLKRSAYEGAADFEVYKYLEYTPLLKPYRALSSMKLTKWTKALVRTFYRWFYW